MEKKERGRELGCVSDLFISSGEEEEAHDEELLEFKGTYADQTEDDFEVEETVSVRKRITYPASEKAQENIRRCLYEHLKDDYTINRIELVKSSEILKLRNMKSKKEEIVITLSPSESH
jgi:hypothetical protein